MDLIRKLEEFRAQEQALAWEGTFAEYFELVKANPRVAQLSHARIYDMIMAGGRGARRARRAAATTSSTTSSSAWSARSSRSWSTSARPPSGWRCASASCC